MKENYIVKVASETAARVASEKAAEIAINVYERQKSRDARQRVDRRLRNTKLLLDNYRCFVAHVNNAVYDIEQAKEESAIFILDMMEQVDGVECMTIESIMRTTTRTAVIVSHIDSMLSVYKSMCENSEYAEDIRRYRIIKSLYIDAPPMSITDLSESESVVPRTIYRDRDIAFNRLAALFFGIDGMQKRR